jgi:hypothetical protein
MLKSYSKNISKMFNNIKLNYNKLNLNKLVYSKIDK